MTVFEDLVTYDALRFLVGVSEIEMTDASLEASGLDLELQAELAQFIPNTTSADDIYTDAIQVDATDAEKLLNIYLSAFSRYYLAAQVLITGVLKFATKISDSQDEMTRKAWDDEEKIRLLLERAGYFKNLLLEALGETPVTATGYSIMGSSQPDFDPVTG
jgi:hypothetical protein